jgi:hypothetical protein
VPHHERRRRARVDYRAAWLPFDHDNGQTPALLALAVDWAEQECAAQGTRGVLIVSRKPIDGHPQPIGEFATGTTALPGVAAPLAAPVLAHFPAVRRPRLRRALGPRLLAARERVAHPERTRSPNAGSERYGGNASTTC